MLWKKESGQEDAVYTDLLQNSGIDFFYNDYQQSCDRMKAMYSSLYEKSAAQALKYRQKGNEVFAEKKWVEATEWYNKSMCFAEEGSELMGLAYANRASCFFNLQMYSKCLVDIESAIQNNYPEEKMAKLDKRKTMCLAAMEKDQSGVFEPKLDYAPNEMFPCFADVLKIENNPKYGRHIVAKEDIDVGKTVMVDQSYFAETIQQKYQRCDICLRMAENLKPCDQCTFAMICPRCEGNSFHEIECSINPIYFGSVAFMSYRIVVVRSILLAMKTFPDIDQLIAVVEEMLSSDAVETPESLSDPQAKYRAFFKLQPNPKETVEQNLPQKIYFIHRLLMTQIDVSTYFQTEAHKRFLIHLIGHHVIVIKNWIRNDRYKTGQKGMFGEDIDMFWEHRMSIPASYFNHSCAPNACIISQNGINTCVVVRSVRKGEQLCVAYDEFIMMKPKAERQEEIRKKFNFHCECNRCEQPHLELSCLKSSLLIMLDPTFRLLGAGGRGSSNYPDILSLKAKAFGLLKTYEKQPWSEEMLQIIYDLYGLALIETSHTSGGVPFLGRPFNMKLD